MTSLLFLALVACSPSSPDAASSDVVADFGAEKSTQSGKYRVSIAFEPSPPVMSELFVARAVVKDRDGEPIEDATVALNATMPHHGHGMMTSPRDEPGVCDDEGTCTHPGGVYETSGFKFHMGGPWTVTAVVTGPNGVDDTSFIYEMQ